MSKFDPEKLPGRSSEAAVYWRAAAMSSTDLARRFRKRAETAEALLKAAKHLLLAAKPTAGDAEWEPTRARLFAVIDKDPHEVADG